MKKLFPLLFLCAFAQCFSQAGSLDTSFGTGGKVLTTINNNERAYGLVIQADNKIVIAGYTFSDVSGNDIICTRYNANGTLDTSFGANGIATFDLQLGSDDKAYSIDIQSDQKLIVAGYSDDGSNKDGVVMRLNINGTLDTTFGSSGKVFTNFSTSGNPTRQDEYKVVKIHALTGNIIVGGSSAITTTKSQAIIARYTSNGTLDTTFGTGGKVINLTDIWFTGLFAIEDLALKSNGKITAVGWRKEIVYDDYYDAYHYHCRLNSNGTLDTTFSTDGYEEEFIDGLENRSYSVILNANDSFYFNGYYAYPYYNQNILYTGLTNASGTMTDETYDFGQNKDVYNFGIAKDINGKILSCGSIYNIATGKYDFFLTRVLTNLSLDTTFGTNGAVSTSFENTLNFALDMKLQSDEKIVVAGYSGGKIALARYNGSATAATDDVTANTLRLHPNPANSFIEITSGNGFESDAYIVFDVNGRQVKSGSLTENTPRIAVDALEKGVYFIKIGEGTTSLKFIKN